MASYFITSHALPGGSHAVHDRSRCPPATFPAATEYLGEFGDASQAIVVARVRYTHAHGCPCCVAHVHTLHARQRAAAEPLSPLRS